MQRHYTHKSSLNRLKYLNSTVEQNVNNQNKIFNTVGETVPMKRIHNINKKMETIENMDNTILPTVHCQYNNNNNFRHI